MRLIPNALLASLPRKTYQALLPNLSPVSLAFGEVLYEQGQPMLNVYFPGTSVVSLLTVVDSTAALEVALVGREGMVGVPLALGSDVSPVRALVQGEGSALRMSKVNFRVALRCQLALQRPVYGYTQSLMSQFAQTAACNRFHHLNSRLARWLLMTRDRMASSEFRVTQEFLSAMLGVRRVGVSEAASSFQRQNLIEYSRGIITIADHDGLEAACCSCYTRDLAHRAPAVAWRPAPAGR